MNKISELKLKYDEIILQRVWAGLAPGGSFETCDKDRLIIDYPGTWNLEEGPDFFNAKITLNDIKLTGDIEIHRTPNDWYIHNHQNDKLYSKVILHVVQQIPVKTTIKPDIPTMVLPNYLIYDFLTTDIVKGANYPEGLCAVKFNDMPEDAVCSYLEKIGMKRLNNKILIYVSEILKFGVENAFLKHLFKTCGYKKNKEAFLDLYERCSGYSINELTSEEKAALLWGESGLLPDLSIIELDTEMNTLVTEIWRCWWLVRNRNEYKKEIAWNLSAVRPFNSPYRRIAALSKILTDMQPTPFTYYLSLFKNEYDCKKIITALMSSLNIQDPLWNQYVNFVRKIKKPTSLIGRNRGMEIAGNLIIPFIIAYSKINNDNEMEIKVFEAFRKLPSGQMNIRQKVSMERWGIKNKKISRIFKTFAAQQGCIYLYKNMCEFGHMNCDTCPVPKQ